MANLPGLLPAGAIMNKAVINIWYQSFSAHIYFGKSLGISLQDHTVGEYLVFLFPHKPFTHNKILISQNTIYEAGTIIAILQSNGHTDNM